MLPNGCRILLFVDFVTFYQKNVAIITEKNEKDCYIIINQFGQAEAAG